MSARLIDGKAIAAAIRAEVAAAVAQAVAAGRRAPGLAAVLVGEDPASHLYVRNKARACEEVGIRSFRHLLPAGTSQAALEALLADLNRDEAVDAILVQLPLPEGLDSQRILGRVDPAKDVDGFHPENVGRLTIGRPAFVPCTPAGILELLDRSGVELRGAEAVVVGRSDLVGKPAALLLLHRHATVTLCHTRTKDLAAHTRRAEVLVAAAGRPRLITGAMVREGAVVIDVGINRVDGALVGDVDFPSVASRAGQITPVPGGVGPMTIAMLLKNTLLAYTRRAGPPV
ncbi:MAG TPA: bifunctional methylenetetrahydrofolate dehydrogenase/methenyltetrahydrofolate cyclohydrolase FolD [Candidatus Methylomirabilis sp.]|nr:bifunctional methylenetetrahydrofolate dehydrogenase/methenyltetrahydrofolate cyclohydrolase FolD [Candidatus Methylomirabilis sp.]